MSSGSDGHHLLSNAIHCSLSAVQIPELPLRECRTGVEGGCLEVAICHEPEAVAVCAEGLGHGGDERYAAPEPWHPEVLSHLSLGILQPAAPGIMLCHA